MYICHPDQHDYVGHGTCDNFYPLQVNLKGPVCGEDDCQKFASFGYPGGLKERCAAHRLDNMVRTVASGQFSTLSATPQLRKHPLRAVVVLLCSELLVCSRSALIRESPRGSALRRKRAKARKQCDQRALRLRDGV